MRGRTCSVLIFFLLLSAQSRAEMACVDLAQLAHSTVGITRYFDEAERNAQSDVVGIHGSALVPVSDQYCHCRARRHCDGTFERGLEAP